MNAADKASDALGAMSLKIRHGRRQEKRNQNICKEILLNVFIAISPATIKTVERRKETKIEVLETKSSTRRGITNLTFKQPFWWKLWKQIFEI